MSNSDTIVPCVLLLAPVNFGKSVLLSQFTRLYPEQESQILTGTMRDATTSPKLYYFHDSPFGPFAVMDLPGEIVQNTTMSGKLLEELKRLLGGKQAGMLEGHRLRACGAIVMMKPPVRSPNSKDVPGTILVDPSKSSELDPGKPLANADRYEAHYPRLIQLAESTGYTVKICSEGALKALSYVPGDFPVAVVANYADLVTSVQRKDFAPIFAEVIEHINAGNWPGLTNSPLEEKTLEAFPWLEEIRASVTAGGVPPGAIAMMPLSATDPVKLHHDAVKLPLYHAMSAVFRRRSRESALAAAAAEAQRRTDEAAAEAQSRADKAAAKAQQLRDQERQMEEANQKAALVSAIKVAGAVLAIAAGLGVVIGLVRYLA